MNKPLTKRNNLVSLLLATTALALFAALLVWPEAAYRGALYGLELWALVLVPSLLPFFITAEIMLNLGIVHMLGVLLEPFMQPVFKLPGATSFVVAMGFTSGFPMGAVLTRRMHEEKLCTLEECKRLVAFTNNSSPLFILAAVGVGMLKNPEAGILLAVAHYSSNILLGIILGFFSGRRSPSRQHKKSIFRRSIQALLQAQENRKPLGTLLRDSIQSGIHNITVIGGFVLVFSVFLQIMKSSSLLEYFADIFSAAVGLLGGSTSLGKPLATGFWEMTLGLRELAGLSISWTHKYIAASLLLGWSGLSIQAQVISALAGTEISSRLYHVGRIFQALLSAIIIYFLANFATPLTSEAIATFSPMFSVKNVSVFWALSCFQAASKCFFSLLFAMLLISMFLVIFNNIVNSLKNGPSHK